MVLSHSREPVSSRETVTIQHATKVTNIVETSVITTETDEYQQIITSTIYPDTDVRCKKMKTSVLLVIIDALAEDVQVPPKLPDMV